MLSVYNAHLPSFPFLVSSDITSSTMLNKGDESGHSYSDSGGNAFILSLSLRYCYGLGFKLPSFWMY